MIRFKTVFHIVGKMFVVFAVALLLPLAVSVYCNMEDFLPFLIAFLISLFIGLSLMIFIKSNGNVRPYEGYLIVVLSWVFASFIGAIPYFIAGVLSSYTSCFFEAMSGFTTTGASVFTDVEILSKPILFWRSMTQWLGGLGIVVLMVALITKMDSGSNLMFRAESIGPFGNRITAHVQDGAKALWIIYLCLTILCLLVFWACGMGFFDSVCHAFTTLATGGFSTKNAGIASYDSDLINWVVTLFMFIGGTAFNLIYLSIVKQKFLLFKDEEFRVYSCFIVLITVLLFMYLTFIAHTGNSLSEIAFSVVNVVSTTGYAHVDYDLWPYFPRMLIIALMLVGACFSSTTSSIRMGSYIILFKNAAVILKKMIHPGVVAQVKVNNKIVNNSVVNQTVQTVLLIFFLCFIGFLLLLLAGLEPLEALTGAISAITNSGPGSGAIGPLCNYAGVSLFGQWVLIVLMLFGRLGIFTFLIIFTPAFWRH